MKNPPEAHLYIADMIRIVDNNSKPDMLGFLPGNKFSVTLTSDSDEPSREFPIGIRELCFFIWVKESIVGNPKTFEIIAPDGESIFPEPLKISSEEYKLEPGAVNAVINLPGFPVLGFGEYKANVVFSEHTYNFSFNVEKIVSTTGQTFKRPALLNQN